MAFAALRKFETGPLTHNEEGLLMSFLRIASVNGLEGSRHRAFQLLRRDTDSHLVWSVLAAGEAAEARRRPEAPAGFMALLHAGRLRQNRALGAGLRLFRQRYPRDRFGLARLAGGQVRLWPRHLEAEAPLRRALLAALARYDKYFETDDAHVTLVQRAPNEYLLGIAPRPRFLRPLTWTWINLASLGWGLLVLGRLMQGRGLLWGSISRKLLGLFFFAVGTPALVLLVVGFYALRDHGNVLRQNLETRLREKLAQYDQRLPAELTRLESWVGRIIREARRARSLAERNAILDRFRQEKTIDQVFVVDKTGSASFALDKPPDEPLARKRTQFSLILCREMLRRLNKAVVFDSGSLVAEATERMFDTLVGGQKTDFNRLTHELGRFTLLTFLDEAAYIYLDAFFDSKGQADSLLLAHMPRERLERTFLDKTLRDLVRQPDIVWRVNALGDVPRLGAVIMDETDRPVYDRISREVRASRSVVRQVTTSGAEEILWVGLRGQNLTRFVLVARTSLRPVEEYLGTLWGWLVLVALLVFVSTAVIGVLLLENILVPVASLEAGISSIRGRRFDHRIPIHADDELGHVSQLMNTMIEGMNDLQVAKVVQESLFPAGALTVGPYRIHGHSRSMADIGGDYYDYFQTPDGQLLGLMGDVSGHGVSAALIMGMAKCALTLDDTPGRSIPEFLATFNRFLLKTIKRRKMMTMFCFQVDPRTHRLTFANAGHNFPFLRPGTGGPVSELAQEAMPLGVRAHTRYATREIDLAPGDTLLLYTDGLVEAVCRNGEQVGYERAKEWYARVAHLPPEQVVERLFAIFDEETTSDQPGDDVSLICLKRMA
jgi:HAMP domain-containing protein